MEVKIPEGARTGKVWVVINGAQASWDGSLLLYDVARAAQVGLIKTGGDIRVFVTNAAGATRGMIQIGYVSEPLTINPGANIQITGQTPEADSLGKKMTVMFETANVLPSTQTTLFGISYPGIGALELLRVELYDANGGLLPAFSNPLNVKLLP